MKRFILMSFVCALSVVALGGCKKEVAGISIEEAYAYATRPVQKSGAAFMTITNNTDADLVITGAKTGVASTVELHTIAMENDVMHMRPVENFTVKAGQSLSLSPQGDHIMLKGLKALLKADERFELTLLTSAGEITANVQINSPLPRRGAGMRSNAAAEAPAEGQPEAQSEGPQ